MLSARYTSLDVFRGATVCFMILVNNAGNGNFVFAPLEHAPWHGCTPTDLIFPFFLFAVGNAFAFAMPRYLEKGQTYFWKKIFKRSILIFLIGLFLNWCPFVKWDNDNLIFKIFANVRILGVLQRIAICYFFASIIIYYCKKPFLYWVAASILLAYWIIVFYFGQIDPYSIQGFVGTKWDIIILGENHLYKGEGIPFDPEGLFSNLSAIVQVIIGFAVGDYLKSNQKSFEVLAKLLLVGITLVFLGYIWNDTFPINKKIWTSSYVLYTSGLAILCLSVLIYFIEFKNKNNYFFKMSLVFGKNALFIFVLSGFLPRVLNLLRWQIDVDALTNKPQYQTPLHWIYQYLCDPLFTDRRLGSLMYALLLIIFYWFIGYLLDRKKIYIKV